MTARLSILGITILIGSAGVAQSGEQRWEAGTELGAVHTMGSNPIFGSAGEIEGGLLRRIGERWGAGGLVRYRHVIDAAPASAFWYGDVEACGQFRPWRRLSLRLEAGWSWRHIGIAGYSNTVGGVVVGGQVGVDLVTWHHWDLGVVALLHVTQTWPTVETFRTDEVGLALRAVFAR